VRAGSSLRVLILVVLAVKPQCFFIMGRDSCDCGGRRRGESATYSRELDLHRVPSALIEAWVGLRAGLAYDPL